MVFFISEMLKSNRERMGEKHRQKEINGDGSHKMEVTVLCVWEGGRNMYNIHRYINNEYIP